MDQDTNADLRRTLLNNRISEQYISALVEKNLLSGDQIFSIPAMSLSFRTGIPLPICEQILDVLTDIIAPKPAEYTHIDFIPKFDDPILDGLIPFPPSGIVELAGLAGSGKSNMAYYLAIRSIINHPENKVVLINTESRVPTARIREIAENQKSDLTADEILDQIVIFEAKTVDELCRIVDEPLPSMFLESQFPPSMIIIDSIAALFRTEFDASSAKLRAQLLFDISSTLKYISSAYGSTVIVTNQATANMSLFASSNDWVPSLGLAWSNCINVRIRITKTSMRRDIVEDPPERTQEGGTERGKSICVPLRTAVVDISPLLQEIRASFYISSSGIHGV